MLLSRSQIYSAGGKAKGRNSSRVGTGGSVPTPTGPVGPGVGQLEDPLLSSPPDSQGRFRGPQGAGVSAPTLGGATSPPPCAADHPPLPARRNAAPRTCWEWPSYLPSTPGPHPGGGEQAGARALLCD